MVSTRRQSGKLPLPLPAAPADDGTSSDEEDDIDGYTSPATNTDDDYFTSKRYTKKGRPSTKRAKTKDTLPRKTAKKKAKGSDLSCIVDMPLDILFEIFGRVSPSDLLNLTRTNKMLRSTLMSKQAITVWKAVFKAMDVPDCPDGFSEPRWAQLLFGGNVCQTCGAKNILRVDFGLRRRICTSCMKDKLVVSSKFRGRFPDYDDLVMDLIPYTNTGGWSHGSASNSKYYWLDDIYSMVKELGRYQKDTKMRKPGAMAALENFTKTRIQFVATNVIHARKCYHWASVHAEKLQEEKMAKGVKRYKDVKARLLGLGYLEKDMLGLAQLPTVNKPAELTDLSWSRIRSAVEAYVNERRADRIARERKPLLDSRKKVIKQVYFDYKKTLVPTQWAYHPDDVEVYQFDVFASLIDDPSDSNIEPSHCYNALQALPSLIDAFNEEKKASLLSLLPREENGSSASDNSDSALNPDRTCLDLATSVFQCTTPGCQNRQGPLIAWQRAICHTCYGHNGRRYEFAYGYSNRNPVFTFSVRGLQAVQSLSVILGLDALASVPADFDRKAARFLCLHCNMCTRLGYHGREAFTWRDCVAHFVQYNLSTHATPSWKLLTPEETLDIKRREGLPLDPADKDDAWSCNHCAAHLENLTRRQPVIDHLKNIHGNINPIEGIDYFYDQRQGRTPRLPVLFGNVVAQVKLHKNSNIKANEQPYRCLHCGGTRRFILNGVTSHLNAKHSVVNPILNRDMEKI